MGSLFELGLLVAVIPLAVYLAADWVRFDLRHRRERAHVERVSGDDVGRPSRDERGKETVTAAGAVAARLKAAGLAGPPEAYVVGAGVLATAAALAVLRLLPSIPIAAFVAMALTVYFLWTATKAWATRRARRFEQRLIDAIDFMIGALSAGASLTQALRSAVSETPLGQEFGEAVQRLDLGMSIDRAFGRMTERYRGEGVCLFTQTLEAKYQSGGDLGPTLRALNEILRERWRLLREIRSQLGGARLTAIGGVMLPYALTALLAWQQPQWFDPLMAHPLGRPLIALAVLLQVVGILWLARILTREV